jgi:hypothetical protein
MISRTIERMRSASSWIFNPACLIDRFLDRIETLSIAAVVPAQDAGLVHREARIKIMLEPLRVRPPAYWRRD